MEQHYLTSVAPADMAQLQQISVQTFSETFAPHNRAEDMQQYLDANFSMEQLTAEVSNAGSLFYFIKNDAQVVGYLKLNVGAAQTEPQGDAAVEIERIYVLAAFQGKKIGQLLYEKALAVARERAAEFVWLGVWEKNYRAIRFYEKNGFVPFDKHVFKLGEDVQTDIMMKKML